MKSRNFNAFCRLVICTFILLNNYALTAQTKSNSRHCVFAEKVKKARTDYRCVTSRPLYPHQFECRVDKIMLLKNAKSMASDKVVLSTRVEFIQEDGNGKYNNEGSMTAFFSNDPIYFKVGDVKNLNSVSLLDPNIAASGDIRMRVHISAIEDDGKGGCTRFENYIGEVTLKDVSHTQDYSKKYYYAIDAYKEGEPATRQNRIFYVKGWIKRNPER